MTPVTHSPDQVYDLAFFKSCFGEIRDERWCVMAFDNGKGQYCAIGHTNQLDERGLRRIPTPMSEALKALFCPLAVSRQSLEFRVSDTDRGWRAIALINNGEDKRYSQSTPRARILAAIDDLMSGTFTPSDPVGNRDDDAAVAGAGVR